MTTSTVPCNGCTTCCRDHMVVLMPDQGDKLMIYAKVSVTHPLNGHQVYALLQVDDEANPGGRRCYYMVDGRCETYANRPFVCRAFDCRQDYQSHDRSERRRRVASGLASPEAYARGRELINAGNRP